MAAKKKTGASKARKPRKPKAAALDLPTGAIVHPGMSKRAQRRALRVARAHALRVEG